MKKLFFAIICSIFMLGCNGDPNFKDYQYDGDVGSENFITIKMTNCYPDYVPNVDVWWSYHQDGDRFSLNIDYPQMINFFENYDEDRSCYFLIEVPHFAFYWITLTVENYKEYNIPVE